MFQPEVFPKQMCCIEVLVTLLELFGAWGIVPPHVTPLLALL